MSIAAAPSTASAAASGLVTSAVPASATASHASTLTDKTSPGDSQAASSGLTSGLGITVVTLALLLVLVVGVLRVIKRFRYGSSTNAIAEAEIPRVLRTVPLGPTQRMVTVRYRGRYLLLGVTATSVSVLDAGLLEAVASTHTAPGNVQN